MKGPERDHLLASGSGTTAWRPTSTIQSVVRVMAGRTQVWVFTIVGIVAVTAASERSGSN